MPLFDQLMDAAKRQFVSDEQKYWEIYLFSHPDVSSTDKKAYGKAMEEKKLFYPGEIRKMYDDMLKARHQAAELRQAMTPAEMKAYFKSLGFSDRDTAVITERMAASSEVRRKIDDIRLSNHPDKSAILNVIRQDAAHASQLAAGDTTLRQITGTSWDRHGQSLHELPSDAIATRFDMLMNDLRESDSQSNGLALK